MVFEYKVGGQVDPMIHETVILITIIVLFAW